MSQPLTAICRPLGRTHTTPCLTGYLRPSRFYERPRDVLRDNSLPNAEKRAILSSSASDACAVLPKSERAQSQVKRIAIMH